MDGETVTGEEWKDYQPTGMDSSQELVMIFTESAETLIEPGQAAQLSFILINQSEQILDCLLDLEGIPREWAALPSGVVRLKPGSQQSLQVRLQLPKSSEARAGEHLIHLKLVDAASRLPLGQVEAALKVSAFTEFTAELHPQRLVAGKYGRVSITNLGNQVDTYTVDWQDPVGILLFEPRILQVEISPGQSKVARFRVWSRERQMFGREKRYPFSVQICLPQGDSQVLYTEVFDPARISRLLIPLVAFIVLLACTGSGLGAFIMRPGFLSQPIDRFQSWMGWEEPAHTADDWIEKTLEASLLPTEPTPLHTAETTSKPIQTGLSSTLPSPTPFICPNTLPARLSVGDLAKVAEDPPLPNRVREAPGLDNPILGQINPGKQVEILEGPRCASDMVWWKVRAVSSRLEGWTSEGDSNQYWLVPLP